MTKIIYAKTRDYIQSLLDTDEIKAYTVAFDEFQNDAEAKKLLADFQESQQTFAILHQGNFDGLKEQEQKVRQLQGLVQKNHKIQTLVKSQQAVQVLVGDLAKEISQAINFPFAQPQRGGCCG